MERRKTKRNRRGENIMGTWGVSSIELVQRLTDFLDELEGDFDKRI